MDSRGRTVLVVDDHEEERKIFKAYLEFVGFRVIAAENGAEALRLAAAEQPSIILLDLVMPVLDGWGAVTRLRGDPATAHIPVVAVTAAKVDELALRRAGFCGYVAKPLSPFQLLEEVERSLGWKSSLPSLEAPPRRPEQSRFARQGGASAGTGSPPLPVRAAAREPMRYGGGAASD